MKRRLIVVGILLLVFAAGFALSSAMHRTAPLLGDVRTSLIAKANAETMAAPPEPADKQLLETAFEVASNLKARDYEKLSAWVHPEQGVVFVPFSTVEPDKNLSFSAAEVKSFSSDTKKRIWGVQHGSGDPINLTPSDYIEQFVYDEDYINAPMVGRNRVIGSGNAIENVSKIFPHGAFIEFYFPGIDSRYEGMDWCSLKLVFEQKNNAYYLVAVIHGEWTI